MRIIQTKGTINNGEITVKISEKISSGEVDVVIIAEKEPDEFDLRHQILKEKGYDNCDKILDLIRDIKLEMLEEKINNQNA
ncbi:hypothetical protein [Geminocystis sp. CENA526]|uniref:hypothetical protein n=1 Tax=Geminocystis sp. CENA526 TaxID=1355871 RepID=UPI003D6E25CF